MKTLLLLFAFCAFSNVKSTLLLHEKTFWEAKTAERTYEIILEKKFVTIKTTYQKQENSVRYKLHETKVKLYFFDYDKEELCIDYFESKLQIRHCDKKLRKSVDEIVTLTFHKKDSASK